MIGSVLISICSIVLYGQATADDDLRVYEKCSFHQSACSVTLSDTRVTLDILPKPVRAMQSLTFTLEISGKPLASRPYIDLDMPAMHMGPNRVPMEPVGEGLYKGVGFIVKCPSGLKVWRATVTLPGVGIADFVFHVLY
jgi:hypothetical protein